MSYEEAIQRIAFACGVNIGLGGSSSGPPKLVINIHPTQFETQFELVHGDGTVVAKANSIEALASEVETLVAVKGRLNEGAK